MRALAALFAVATLAACGPIRSAKVIRDADAEIEAARAAGAQKSATYEFTGAEAYLHQARVEVGYANYTPALQFAEKARDLAREARKKAAAASQKSTEAP